MITFKPIIFIFIIFTHITSKIPCSLHPTIFSEREIIQAFSYICKKKNLKFSNEGVWGLDKIRRPQKIGEGSFGKIFALSQTEVYKEMVIENPENLVKAYNEVAASGCISDSSSSFAIAKDCYYFNERTSGGTKLTLWLLMDRFETDLFKLIKSRFAGIENIIQKMPFETWKLHLMTSLAEQIYFIHKTNYIDTNKNGTVDSIKGIIHRDIKSENIMLDKQLNPYFGDFGFAIFGSKSVDKLGTPDYGAPEMFSSRSRGPFGFELDVFSLGVVFYEIINSTQIKPRVASQHFSLEDGHQKAFSPEDFPGFEWMIEMVDPNPTKRLSMRNVYNNLRNIEDNQGISNGQKKMEFRPQNIQKMYKQYLGQENLDQIKINQKIPFEYEKIKVKRKFNEPNQNIKMNEGEFHNFKKQKLDLFDKINYLNKKEEVNLPNIFLKDFSKIEKISNSRINILPKEDVNKQFGMAFKEKNQIKDDFEAFNKRDQQKKESDLFLPQIKKQRVQSNQRDLFRKKNFESNFQLGRVLI